MPERVTLNTESDPWDRFGVCNHPNLVDNNATQQSKFAEVASMGLKWMRTDFRMSTVVPTTRGVYVWTQSDLIVSNATAVGIKVLPILGDAVNWANGTANDNTVPPLDSQDYADYCAAVVNRYYPLGVTHYELWNEPNIQAFWNKLNVTGVQASKYYDMLKKAYTSIKAVQPQAQVLFGGLALDTLTENDTNHVSANIYLQGAYAAGCKDYFDIFAFHPYGWNLGLGANDPDKVIAACRATMNINGDSNKKIWFTEYGRPSGGDTNFSTEISQADQLQKAIRLFRKLPYAERMFFYTFRDFELPTDTTDREDHYGVAKRSDGSLKPSYQVIRDTIQNG